jgi:hypothetical protein
VNRGFAALDGAGRAGQCKFLLTHEPLASRKRYGVIRCYLTVDLEEKWSEDENGIAAVQRRCRAGSRH